MKEKEKSLTTNCTVSLVFSLLYLEVSA